MATISEDVRGSSSRLHVRLMITSAVVVVGFVTCGGAVDSGSAGTGKAACVGVSERKGTSKVASTLLIAINVVGAEDLSAERR